MHALYELRKGNNNSTEANTKISKAVANVDDKSQLRESGNKLITEFFHNPSGVATRQVGFHVETHQQEDRTTMIPGRKELEIRLVLVLQHSLASRNGYVFQEHHFEWYSFHPFLSFY